MGDFYFIIQLLQGSNKQDPIGERITKLSEVVTVDGRQRREIVCNYQIAIKLHIFMYLQRCRSDFLPFYSSRLLYTIHEICSIISELRDAPDGQLPGGVNFWVGNSNPYISRKSSRNFLVKKH